MTRRWVAEVQELDGTWTHRRWVAEVQELDGTWTHLATGSFEVCRDAARRCRARDPYAETRVRMEDRG